MAGALMRWTHGVWCLGSGKTSPDDWYSADVEHLDEGSRGGYRTPRPVSELRWWIMRFGARTKCMIAACWSSLFVEISGDGAKEMTSIEGKVSGAMARARTDMERLTDQARETRELFEAIMDRHVDKYARGSFEVANSTLSPFERLAKLNTELKNALGDPSKRNDFNASVADSGDHQRSGGDISVDRLESPRRASSGDSSGSPRSSVRLQTSAVRATAGQGFVTPASTSALLIAGPANVTQEKIADDGEGSKSVIHAAVETQEGVIIPSGIRETPRRFKSTFGVAESVPLLQTQADPPAPPGIRLVHREVEDVCDGAGIIPLQGAEAEAQVAPAIQEVSRELEGVAGPRGQGDNSTAMQGILTQNSVWGSTIRYFVLMEDHLKSCSTARSDAGGPCQSMLLLEGSSVTASSGRDAGDARRFEVTGDVSSFDCTWALEADSEEERDSWISALGRTIHGTRFSYFGERSWDSC